MYLELMDETVSDKIKDSSFLIYREAEAEFELIKNSFELENLNIKNIIDKPASTSRIVGVYCSKFHEIMDKYLMYKAKYLREQRKEKRDSSYWMSEQHRDFYSYYKKIYDLEKIKEYAIDIKKNGCIGKCVLASGSEVIFSKYFGFLMPHFPNTSKNKSIISKSK